MKFSVLSNLQIYTSPVLWKSTKLKYSTQSLPTKNIIRLVRYNFTIIYKTFNKIKYYKIDTNTKKLNVIGIL